jgi:hypothetical protein
MNRKIKEIQKRLSLALRYFRVLKRLTAGEISKKTGVNFYLIENGKRYVSLSALVKFEEVFGEKTISRLVLNAWADGGEWSASALMKRISDEEEKWRREKTRSYKS